MTDPFLLNQDSVFRALLGNSRSRPQTFRFASERFPQVNVSESEDAFTVDAELPGVAPADVEIVVLGEKLTIKGERKAQAPEGARMLRRERSLGSFTRVLQFPVELEADKVEAQLKNGVLNIKLTKSPAARPRKIEINAH